MIIEWEDYRTEEANYAKFLKLLSEIHLFEEHKDINAEFVNFMKKCLAYAQNERPTWEEATRNLKKIFEEHDKFEQATTEELAEKALPMRKDNCG
jgi:hypothetical protein